jgi:hypothetical protein
MRRDMLRGIQAQGRADILNLGVEILRAEGLDRLWWRIESGRVIPMIGGSSKGLYLKAFYGAVRELESLFVLVFGDNKIIYIEREGTLDIRDL